MPTARVLPPLMAPLAALLVTCHAEPGRPPPQGAARTMGGTAAAKADARDGPAGWGQYPRVSEARGLDPNLVIPPEGSPLARARAALDAGKPGEARQIAKRSLAEASDAEAGRLRWVAADAALAEDDEEASMEWLAPLAQGDHPLSRWARIRRAQRLLEETPEQTLDEVAKLTESSWAGQKLARSLEARALARAGRAEEAIPALRRLVEEAPDDVGAATPGLPLAKLLADRDDREARERALALYRRIATRAPLARVGRQAERRVDEVLSTLPAARRRALREVPIADALARAHALYDAMHHERAEKAFEKVAARIDDDRGKRCRAMLYQGRAIIRQRDRKRGAAFMDRLAARCPARSIRAWAYYYKGRAHAARSEHDEALTAFRKLQRVAPEHRLADDALYRAALVARDQDDREGMRRRLRAVPRRYPGGDMRGRARFRLAWDARERGAHRKALAQLEQLLTEGPQENREALVGRARYWKARTLASLDRAAEAADAYEAVVRAYPLSYYAQQALVRLDASHPERAKGLREEMRGDGDPPALQFPYRREMGQPAFERAIELLRVGAVRRARRELHALGMSGSGADDDARWVVAALLDRAGAHPEASRLVRRHLPGFRRSMPVGRAWRQWRLAYPKAFSPLIEGIAAQESVPPSFVRAVAREESGFDPRAVSVAHAYGLIQLIRPTAKRFARKLDLPADPASLRKPEVNLRIGTRFISFLWKRFEGNRALVPAAYNAGEGAVSRWLEARPKGPVDEWIENIPYRETRRYTRRVLQTYGVYRWLDEGELPELPLQL